MSPVDRRARRFDAKHVVIASRGAIPRVVFSIVRLRRRRCPAAHGVLHVRLRRDAAIAAAPFASGHTARNTTDEAYSRRRPPIQ
ncbi:hypothetical protein BURMUCGD1_0032 [Burkholderia multivorans CGD1]|nr:hypothetical protein BURMUCGD1_0032 [Burkholderia multivorans CGD1]